MLENDIGPSDFNENKEALTEIYPDVAVSTLEFIVASYESI
jgi:hypothetical protein